MSLPLDIPDPIPAELAADALTAEDLLAWWPLLGDGLQAGLRGLPRASVTGATPIADAERGPALGFDGNDHLDAMDPVFDPPEPNRLTVMVWVQPADLNAYQTLLGKRNTVTNAGWELSLRGDLTGDRLQFTLFGIVSVNSAITGLTVGTWYHVAVTYDQQQQSLRFYLDGALLSSHAQNNAIRAAPTLNLFVGAQNGYGNPTRWYSGGLQDCRILARAASGHEIAHVHQLGLGEACMDVLLEEDYLPLPTVGAAGHYPNKSIYLAGAATGLIDA